MMEAMQNNFVEISGEVVTYPKFSHTVAGESFYSFYIETRRLSGAIDRLQVISSERAARPDEIRMGGFVDIAGEFRSYNNNSGVGSRLVLFLFVKELELVDARMAGKNRARLTGYICKAVGYRKTPLGREIADLILAVPRVYGKSDYIPCIAWGRNARYAQSFPVGSRITVGGRLQSREYIKALGDVEETRTAYEVSIASIEEC